MKKRMTVFCVFLSLCTTALIGYLSVLFLGNTERNVSALVGRRTKTVSLYTLKGTIYDRDLTPITNAKKGHRLLVDPRTFDLSAVGTLAKISGADEDRLRERLQKESVFILTSTQKPQHINGVYSFDSIERYDNTACHLIGYVNSDGKGMSGLEKCYDKELSYFGGSKSISFSTDGVSNPMFGLGMDTEGDNGDYQNGLVTTLDKDLQTALETAMKHHIEKGAAVVLDADSGEILAMCSRPEFDADHIEAYLDSTGGELINKALTAQTVGSVFKIAVAAAAIEQKLDAFEYTCPGNISVGGRTFGCHKEGGHGKIGLEQAFSESCNVYFIALAQMLGSEAVSEMAKRLGFGTSLEIADGLSASAGNLPKISAQSSRQLANFSIGQGELMASPIQICRLIALCGNGGYLLQPTLIKGFYVDGKMKSEQYINYRTSVIDKKTAEKLRKLCVATVQSGTGKSACPDGGSAGGKTASAQTGMFLSDGSEVLNTYFAGFFPAERPKYAIAVFAENGESGGKTNAPVFKEFCEYILQND